MANSRRKCFRCGAYKPADELVVVGIQARCAAGCEPPKRSSSSRKALPRMSQKRADPAAVAERAEERAAVFARDRQCRLHGVTGAGICFGPPTFHHILKASAGGAYNRANGCLLCASHNDRIESDADLAKLAHSLGLVIRRSDLPAAR